MNLSWSDIWVPALVGMGCLFSVVLTALRLPGTWLIVAGAALLGWLTHWTAVSVKVMLWIFGLALLAELLELLMSVVLARSAGGSRRAAWGALIGGFAGMLFLSLPLPVVGSMIGALLGCFLGALIGECSVRGSLFGGTRVGVFAALGFAVGTATKVGLALVMSVLVVAATIAADGSPPAAPEPAAPIVEPALADP